MYSIKCKYQINLRIKFSFFAFYYAYTDNTSNSNAQETPVSENQESNDVIRPVETIFIERNIRDHLIMNCYTTEGR